MWRLLSMIIFFSVFATMSTSAVEIRPLSNYFNGLAFAETIDGEKVIIDEQGTIVLSLTKLDVSSAWGKGFSEGLMGVMTKDKKYGYIDKAGKMVISPRYSYVEPFSEELAAVCIRLPVYNVTKSKWGYIRKNGEVVIPLQYDNVTSFHEGRAFVYRESGWFLIDQGGKFVSNQAFEAVRDFSEGVAPVRVNKRWGYIDGEGAWKILPCFIGAFPFNDGLAGVAHIDRPGWDFIDKEGNVIFEQVVDTIHLESSLYFREGWAIIPKENKYWYLSIDGKRLPAIYDRVTDFNEGVAT
jgi:hypothetical protein